MTPLRKPFQGDPLFPMEMVYRTKKSPQLELPHHLHDLYELVYVYQGKGTFFIENKLMEKKKATFSSYLGTRFTALSLTRTSPLFRVLYSLRLRLYSVRTEAICNTPSSVVLNMLKKQAPIVINYPSRTKPISRTC